MVNAAEDRRRVVVLHKGARSVVDGLARDCHVVGVHHAVDKADVHPLCNQGCLPRGDRAQKRKITVRRTHQFGVVARDRVFRELAQLFHVATGQAELEGADAQMALGHARQHRTGQRLFAVDRFARGGNRQRARGRDAERVHRLPHQHFAQHRAERGLAVAAAGEWCAARALEGDVTAPAGPVYHFAQQQRTPVAKPRREAAKLVTGIRLRYRLRALRQGVAGKKRGTVRPAQRRRVQAQFRGERVIEEDQPRRSSRGGLPLHVKVRQVTGVGIVEMKRLHRWYGIEVVSSTAERLGPNNVGSEASPACLEGRSLPWRPGVSVDRRASPNT